MKKKIKDKETVILRYYDTVEISHKILRYHPGKTS